MAWLAAGGAGSAAGGAAASGAGSAAAAGAAEGALGTAAEGAATSAAESAATEGAATAGSETLKNSLAEEGTNALINEATKQDDGPGDLQQFKPATISSDSDNKIVTAKFGKVEPKKPDNTTEIGKMAKGLVNTAEEIVSCEDKKTDIDDVSSEEPKSSTSRFNAMMRNLGQELGAYAKDEGKNLISTAIANDAQPQQVQPMSQVFSGNTISSDEELKTDIKDAGGLVPLFSTIDSYLYKYKDSAQDEYAGTGMVNDDNNLGVMAQELQENPLTEPAVKTDEKGNLALDTGRLTSINTAMIAELCKKVQAIEEQMYGRAQ